MNFQHSSLDFEKNIYALKSLNSNFTHQNFDKPRLTFCLIFWGKKGNNMAWPGFEPMISRLEVDHANHYSIGPLITN